LTAGFKHFADTPAHCRKRGHVLALALAQTAAPGDMLSHLHIQDFAIAPELELDFEPGFTVITGETGAGKSILVDALGLLLGDRSDASWVRAGAERAQLHAEFTLAHNEAARRWLADAELGDEAQCLLRRSIAANGRSRAWINGTPVTVQQLGELGALLVELHGQNEHLSLTRAAQQLQLLDHSGRYASLRENVSAAHAEWRALERDFAALAESSALDAGELDLLRYQHQELEQHAIEPDALEALEAEHALLSRSGDLLESLDYGLAALTGEENALTDQLHRVIQRLTPFEEFDANIAEACKMLQEAAINAQEAGGSLRFALDRIDMSPERLEAVRLQLGQLGDLARKHHLTLEQLPEHRDELARRLEQAEDFEGHRAGLEQELAASLARYREIAARLSQARAEHAQALSERVTGLISELGMQGGVFELRVRPEPEGKPSRYGDDRIELLVSANPGFPPGPLAKIASGGELSRISLAIKVATASNEQRTQIFDEVDAGIGGDTANTVGRLLHRLSTGGQALCVTHLAQVAVCANRQLRVDKHTTADTVQLGTQLLDHKQRVEEIARMLSGRPSEQSLAHARELLATPPV
jgi:DNA repair protein RecN (Recombination protein N)